MSTTTDHIRDARNALFRAAQSRPTLDVDELNALLLQAATILRKAHEAALRAEQAINPQPEVKHG